MKPRGMLELMKILIPLVILSVGFLYVFQDRMIFFPQATPLQNKEQFAEFALSLEHEDIRLQGWYVPGAISATRPLVVYYGGNAEEVSGNLWDRHRFEAGGFLFMNYRGYGGSEGKPSQKTLCRDALFLLDTLVVREKIPLDQVVLMGRSLGSGVAVHVAAHREVRGVILITPFDSLLNVARHHYPIMPVKLLLKHPFDSAALAPHIDIPALVVMGDRDNIIPNKYSTRLATLWGGPVDTVMIEGRGHNDIQLDGQFWQAINTFLSGAGVAPDGSTAPEDR